MRATPTVLRWNGWWRADKQSRWTRVVENAGSYEDCRGLLLDALARIWGGESLVLRSDSHPEGRAARPGAPGRGRRRS